ncbi:light-regulated signal transduction histidine kinase (bacteriophytochrome) [Deinobacterium chartae]|uniref:histidine kinase n=1 Tax=Deinobacterium chartae TaxID=521158 RepID=A0A841HYA5_9DEIO|nr:ATP-binding protein [Deinobacterium chartae]MBB6097634.1 light-regulated signal transduction histidine kinase (bacteriophytochrome) [Deinobacterium chartae]
MMDSELLPPENLGGPRIDTTNCAREPIHIPGSIQPHGALLVLTAAELRIVQVSANVEHFLGHAPEQVLGRSLADLAAASEVEALARFLAGETLEKNAQYVFCLNFGERRVYDATAHRADALVIVELEEQDAAASSAGFYHSIKNALSELEGAEGVAALLSSAARQVRHLTGFDRVMIYRFAEDDSGEVVAEAQREDLHSFLGHRFPESDIPRQARALYVKNLLRLTADVDAPPSPLVPLLNPVTGAPLNLGGAVLRSTSPMHLQYLRNMEVASSLSVSIVQDGRLWGLISCHHTRAKIVPQAVRAACEFLGRVLALQISAKRAAETFRLRQELQQHNVRIVNAVTGTLTPLEELVRPELNLAAFVRAGGVALRFDGRSVLLGATPDQVRVDALVGWLKSRGELEYHSSSLSRVFPQAAEYARLASGVLGVSVSAGWDEYIVWFRPEVPLEITWGGNPNKPVQVTADGTAQLTPRASFAAYVETVRETALPWHPAEVEEVSALRATLVEAQGARLTLLRELNARLERTNRELERSNAELRRFAFVTAHDLQEPLRVLNNFLGLFSKRYVGRLDADADQLISFAMSEAGRLRSLIRDLYAYTEIGTGPADFSRTVSLEDTLSSVLSALQPRLEETRAVLVRDPLPQVRGNPGRLEQVLHHLLDNALKFSGPLPPRVHVSAEVLGSECRVSVRDQGIGIAPEYFGKIFEVFQRLNRLEDYPGNGIGLAICRKIVEQHGGQVWVESVLGQGSTFCFTVPVERAGGRDAPTV